MCVGLSGAIPQIKTFKLNYVPLADVILLIFTLSIFGSQYLWADWVLNEFEEKDIENVVCLH